MAIKVLSGFLFGAILVAGCGNGNDEATSSSDAPKGRSAQSLSGRSIQSTSSRAAQKGGDAQLK